MATKNYLVTVQCHIVKERCSGYFCEAAFNQRTGGFSKYPKNKKMRFMNMTCGGCCGRAVHRKLSHLIRQLKKEKIGKDQIVVQLASCITKDNFHAPPCPHLDYLKNLIGKKLKLDIAEDTKISDCSEKRRKQGIYQK